MITAVDAFISLADLYHEQLDGARFLETNQITDEMDGRRGDEQDRETLQVDETDHADDSVNDEVHVADAEDHRRAGQALEQRIGLQATGTGHG